jgi:hypothetical protein
MVVLAFMEDTMLKQIIAYTALVSFAMVGSSLAQPVEQSNDVSKPSVVASAPQQIDKVIAVTYPASEPPQSGPGATHSPEFFLTEIVTWLAANFELPALHNHPNVEFISRTRLAHMRYGAFLTAGSHAMSVNERAQAVHRREVVAVYNDATRTIFLAETWTGATSAELSVLVHEMVHHLQNLGKLKYECPAARETLAYLAQDRWLKQVGLDLEKEFEIDMFTVMATSACMR